MMYCFFLFAFGTIYYRYVRFGAVAELFMLTRSPNEGHVDLTVTPVGNRALFFGRRSSTVSGECVVEQ